MPGPGPLLLEPVFIPKVWAGGTLPLILGRTLNPPPGTGEVWLASDRHHVTPVARGELKGLGLDEAVKRYPEWLLGKGAAARFPLLLKILNVGQWLSVQVHPDDEAARRLEGEPWGKSEAWHVLEASPGAEIIHGLAPGVARRRLEEALARGRISEVLARVPAEAGDTFHLPAGTVHATGPGLVIFEVQQTSDVTYRFYDWDRQGLDGRPRPLHQRKALEVMKPGGPGRACTPRRVSRGGAQGSLLVADPHFSLICWELSEPLPPPETHQEVRLVFVLEGRGVLKTWQGGEKKPSEAVLEPAACWIIPAGLDQWQVEPRDGKLSIMEAVAG